jgi:NAD(P)-dependent dehydrogenase (short-subunit alcohol dehydrogenase family)
MTRRTAVATGGAKGIGAATVRALVADGMSVTFCARDADSVAALEQELHAEGGTVLGVAADIAVYHETAQFFDLTRTTLGPVDVLVALQQFLQTGVEITRVLTATPS